MNPEQRCQQAIHQRRIFCSFERARKSATFAKRPVEDVAPAKQLSWQTGPAPDVSRSGSPVMSGALWWRTDRRRIKQI